MTDRFAFTVVLRPGSSIADPIRALRGLLKVALRRYGMRCLSATENSSADGSIESRGSTG